MKLSSSSICKHLHHQYLYSVMSQVFKILSLSFFLQIVFYRIYCAQEQFNEFPQLLTENTYDRQYLTAENRKLSKSKYKTVHVHNRMACVHQCTRMADSCTSVNFKKQATNGLHSCELMTSDIEDHPDALQNDLEFDQIILQLPIYPTCMEIVKAGGTISGVYSISPSPTHPIQVYCDMVTSGGGWTVIQKRIDGSVDFYRDWADYERGFGNKLGEYWLGLDNIHRMTSQRSYRLRVDMEDFEEKKRYAEYGLFKVADESDNYRLTVGPYTGTAGNSLSYHSTMQFSTKDRDNDASSSRDCVNEFLSGWWYNSCHLCNPNGLYLNGAGSAFGKGITWYEWKKVHTYSMKRMELKIRPEK